MKNSSVPPKITLDAYAVSPGRVREMKEDGELTCRVKVQDGQARRVQCDDDGTLERGTRSLSPQFAITEHGGA
jgi:hypothetical protein